MSKAWFVLGNFTYLLAYRTLCLTHLPVTVSLGPRTASKIPVCKDGDAKCIQAFPWSRGDF